MERLWRLLLRLEPLLFRHIVYINIYSYNFFDVYIEKSWHSFIGCIKLLVNMIRVYDNPDKPDGKKKSKGWEILWPARIFITGPPGCGKRNTLLNYYNTIKPKPDRTILIHLDPNTTEYDIIEHEKMKLEDFIDEMISESEDRNHSKKIEYNVQIDNEPVSDAKTDNEPISDNEPASECHEKSDKNLVIIDEINISALPKAKINQFRTLFNYISTHKNTTVILSYQDFFRVPTEIRDACNQFAIFRDHNLIKLKLIAIRIGENVDTLYEIVTGLLRYNHDFMWVDMDEPKESLWHLRLNFYSPIRRKYVGYDFSM